MAVVEPLPEAPGGRRRLRLSSPATLEPLGEIEVQTADDVRAAVERARKVQSEWAALSFERRGRYLRRAVRLLLEREGEIVAALARETGKPEFEILATEVAGACDALEYTAKVARRVLAERSVSLHLLKTKRLRVAYRPVGVVGVITPWNFPFLLALNPTAQALMAGNAVVLKPSEATPFSGRWVQDLFEAAGLPEGLVTCLLGDAETGAALVEAPIDKLHFTGSVATGRRVAEACGRRLLPCTLELGGKDPMIVCADADLERAANGAVFGAFANAGQVCASTERVYVHDAVAGAFLEKVVRKTAELRQGLGGEADVGPLIWPAQLEVIERHVEDARRKGARVLAGGRRHPDYPGIFYEPTVLADVTHEMDVMREETFGPVLPVMRVRDEEEALRLANETSYGLSASVWTRDRRKAVRLARSLDAGTVVANDSSLLPYAIPEAPFGGVKQSGVGRVNGEVGLRSFCQVQALVVSRFGGRSEPVWFPYTARKTRWLRRAMRALWGGPLGRWLS